MANHVPGAPRDIILDHKIENDVDRYVKQYPHFEDAFLGLQWTLAHNPAQGVQFIGSNRHIYVQESEMLVKTPTIWVVYSFNDEAVTIHGICAVPAQMSDD